MLLQTLLNDCHKFQGFKYGKVDLDRGQKVITVELLPDERFEPRCSLCHEPRKKHDTQRQRSFQFIPFWGYKVRLMYRPRRVRCENHGVVMEDMPWALGKSPICKAFSLFLAHWAKKLSWKETAESFRVSWDTVYTSVKYVVDYGLKHRSLDNISAIGVDEVLFKRGYKFATLVYEITDGHKRLLWVGLDRKAKTLLRFFRMLGRERSRHIKAVCCDMWEPFLKVIKKKIPQAVQILDRFHIMRKFNEAIDDVRRQEAKVLAEKGKGNILLNARWCVLKKPENLNQKQEQKLSELVSQNLKTLKVYLLRESFQKFWEYTAETWARKFLKEWCFIAMRSKIEPIKKVARMLRRHKDEILNWFKLMPRISNGVVEGFNNKVKLVMRKAYGYRTFGAFETALYHTMGQLPEPCLNHSFV